jgi:hypothetical protein
MNSIRPLKHLIIISSIFFLACSNPSTDKDLDTYLIKELELDDTSFNSLNKDISKNKDIEHISGFIGKQYGGAVKDSINEVHGELKIDFNQSEINQYWIAISEKTKIKVKISEPDYIIQTVELVQ